MGADLAHIAVAAGLFPLLMAAPLYWLCAAADLFGFRKQDSVTRAAILLLASIAVAPGVFFLAGLAAGFTGIYLAIGAGAAASSVMYWRNYRARPTPPVRTSSVMWLVAALLAAVSLSLIDLEWGHKLFFNTVAQDWTGRVAVTQAVVDSGVPPVNPSFHPGRPLALFYYYFWFLAAAVCERASLGLVNARQALAAGAFYPACGLVALVFLYLRFEAGDFRRRLRLALLLLLVSGLDILPWAIRMVAGYFNEAGYPYESIETWNTQVTAWTGTALWVPNHLAAFVAAGFLLFLVERWSPAAVGRQAWWVALMGVGITSVLGMSVWVGLVLAAILLVWFLVAAVRRWRAEAVFLLAAGAAAVILSIPFLLTLAAARQTSRSALEFAVRPFTPAALLMDYFDLQGAWLRSGVHLALLPLSYFLELGFFGIIGVLRFRKLWRAGSIERTELLRVVTLLVSVTLCSFVGSSLANNDFGWRGFLFAQFVLLLWGAEFLANGWSGMGARTTRVAAACLWLGAITTAADFAMLRFSAMLEEAARPESRVASRNYFEREAYAKVDAAFPKPEFVQHNPAIPLDMFNSLFGLRAVVVADRNYASLYGVDPAWAESYTDAVARPFFEPLPQGLAAYCREFGITALAARDSDPVWSDRGSWVWTSTPAVANEFTRVIPCGAR